MLVVVLPAQAADRSAARRVSSSATDPTPDSCQQDRVPETDQAGIDQVQVDRGTDQAGIGREDLAPGTDREEFRRQVVPNIDNVVRRGGQTSGGHFVCTPHICRHSVRAFGAAIRIGAGVGPATVVIGGDGPRGQP